MKIVNVQLSIYFIFYNLQSYKIIKKVTLTRFWTLSLILLSLVQASVIYALKEVIPFYMKKDNVIYCFIYASR